MTMLEIRAEWDSEAGVWVAASEDVPGLITETATLDALVERLQVIILKLMELNCGITGQAFPFRVIGYKRLGDFGAFSRGKINDKTMLDC